MDLTKWLLGDDSTSEGRLAHEFSSAYTRHKAFDFLADELYESEDEKLEREDQRLSIGLKRRQLGLPWTDDQLENATNDDSPFWTRSRNLAGLRTLQAIPSPSLLDGPHATLPWSKPAQAIQGSNSVIDAIKGIGGSYVRSRLFR
jgi:hypothetical protein